MTASEATRWCPHCHQLTPSDSTHSLGVRDRLDHRLSAPEDPRGFWRKMICGRCQQVWRSVELPAAFFDEMLTVREEVEETHRQLAMLRMLLAYERQNREAPNTEDPPADEQRRAA